MKKVYLLVLVMFCSIVSVFGQVTIESTEGYAVHVSVEPKTIIVYTDPCNYGYEYAVEVAYNITFSGTNIPTSGLYTLQGNLGCEENSMFFDIPNTGGTGTVVTSRTWTAKTDCGTATPESLDCFSTATLEIEGPGISKQFISFTPATLPVTLLYFSATPQSQAVEINWASSKAWGFSHYELERSADGKAFDYVTTIDAAEFSNGTIVYSYSDRQPLFGTSYYRLKAVDIDGSFEYKEMAAVKFGAESFKVYPNPSSQGFITVSWSHATEGTSAVIKDNSGRTIREIQLSSNTETISTEGLASGVYFLTVQGPAGQKQAQVLIR